MKLEPPRKGVPRLKPKPDISPIIDDPTNTCRSCNYQFVNRLKYRSHLARAHKIKLEPLHKTAPKLQPQPNVAPVIDDSNNYCRSCKYQFSGKRSYRLHLMRIHKMKLKPLRKSVPQLKPQTDLSPVPDDPSNTCRSCNHQFSSKTAYRRHLKYIHKMKLEPLEKSIPKLKSQPNIIPVADDPNHTCRSCNYQFSSKNTYRSHLIKIHKMRLEPLPSSVPKLKAQPNVSPIADNSTSYCRSCNYQFARRRNYRLHLMTAHKVKLEPLKGVPRLKPQSNIIPIIDDPNNTCRSCNYQFVSKYAYRNHLMKTHKRKSESLPKRLEFEPLPKRLPPVVDDPNNNCRSCNYQFSGRRAYRKHLMNLHKLELEPSRKSIPKLKAQPSILPVVDDPNHTCQSW